MKAIIQDRYGSADVLELTDIDTPEVGTGEVLLRVHAASAFIGDWHVMTGLPYLGRLAFGLRVPKLRVRGQDVAGRVEAVGEGVTQFQVGDEVFGTCRGSFADSANAGQDKVAHKPANLTFQQAATVPTTGTTALQAVRDKGNVKSGQRVLIIGADVTGVCSTSKMDLVRSIGADDVIDYTRDDFTDGTQHYDVVLDIAGARPVSLLRRALAPRGTLVIVGGEGGGRWFGGIDRQLRATMLSPFVAQRLGTFVTKPNADDLIVLKGLIEDGQVRPVIDRTYPLSEVPMAIRYLAEGHARGKVVITI
jgi:NADPH:quinone reductase-like Zn-dependent oxidoreductase